MYVHINMSCPAQSISMTFHDPSNFTVHRLRGGSTFLGRLVMHPHTLTVKVLPALIAGLVVPQASSES